MLFDSLNFVFEVINAALYTWAKFYYDEIIVKGSNDNVNALVRFVRNFIQNKKKFFYYSIASGTAIADFVPGLLVLLLTRLEI